MTEQFGEVFRKTAASAMGPDYVDAMVACVTASTRWTVPFASPGKALLRCVNTGAEVVLSSTTSGSPNMGQILVGYAPDGGVSNWDTTPSAPVWTGMRNITGNTSLITSAIARVAVSVYEDAILFAVEATLPGWRVAALAGRALEPMDDSDVARHIGVDALFVGTPNNLTAYTQGTWLVGTTTAGLGSCARVGSSFVPLWGVGNRYAPTATITPTQLDRVGSVERFVPYLVHTLSGTTGGGALGATKYIRQWRANLDHGSRLFSGTAGSNQAWVAYRYLTNSTTSVIQNQVALWAKTETTV